MNAALTGAGLVGFALVSGCLASGCGWEANTKIDPPGVASPRSAEAPPDVDVGEGAAIQAERTALWSDAQQRRADARIGLDEDELHWIATPQDARTAFLVSRETGFDAWGLETRLAEIPVGWHTGRQRQGEQAIYVVHGNGFAVVNGVRFDFADGTTLGIPYAAERQLFNTGAAPVRYFSATAFPIERHLGLYHLEQLEDAGPNGALPEAPTSDDGFDARDRRIRLFWEEAWYRDGTVGLRARLEATLRGGVDLLRTNRAASGEVDGEGAALASRLAHHSAWVRLMGDGGQMGFDNQLVLISGFLIDDPGAHSGSHSHNEALIYVVQGEGYSLIDGVKVPWRAGTSLHIQGPQTRHQHFNTGDEPAFLLRIASGLRPIMERAMADVFPRQWWEAHEDAVGDDSRL